MLLTRFEPLSTYLYALLAHSHNAESVTNYLAVSFTCAFVFLIYSVTIYGPQGYGTYQANPLCPCYNYYVYAYTIWSLDLLLTTLRFFDLTLLICYLTVIKLSYKIIGSVCNRLCPVYLIEMVY